MTAALRPLRNAVKNAAGRMATAALPQCEFRRALFIFGHMRCGSTALSNILCSRPDISGYGEAHITYDSVGALGRLVINQRRRGAWKPAARYLFDKVLHNRYDSGADPRLAQARALFMVRIPTESILSIRTLFARIGSAEYGTDAAAADYYEQRLENLADLWHKSRAERRLGTSYAALTTAPDAFLARASAVLGMDPPLANAYRPRSQVAGAGDPLSSHRFSAIVPAAASTTLAATARPLDIPVAQLARLDALYANLCALFAADA
jgi:hypothetical protein